MSHGKTGISRRKMKSIIKKVTIVLAIVLAAGLIVLGCLALFTDAFNPLVELYELKLDSSNMGIAANSENIFDLEKNKLCCFDFDGDVKWEYAFREGYTGIDVSDTLECMYSDKSAVMLDSGGNSLFSVPAAEYEIISAKCGEDNFAVLCSVQSDSTVYCVRVFSYDGTEIYRADYEDSSVLSYSLYGETDNLWVLTLDTSGVYPVSRIHTYSPTQNALTGTLEISDQLISDVYFSGSNMFLSGTYNLLTYDTFGNKESSTLVYGLKCADSTFSGNNYAMVYMQRSDDTVSQANTVRVISVINGTESDTFLQLPSESVSVYTSLENVYCVKGNSISAYKLNGEFYRSVELGFTVQSSFRISDNKVVLIDEDGLTYYMQLA